MDYGYLINEINKNLKELSELLGKNFDNYNIELIEKDMTCINDENLKKYYYIRATYTEEIGDE